MMISVNEYGGTYFLEVEKHKVVVSLEANTPEDLVYKASFHFSQQSLDIIEKEINSFIQDNS